MSSPHPPPPPRAPPPPAGPNARGSTPTLVLRPSPARTGAARVLSIAVLVGGIVVVLLGSLLFLEGDRLFDSDPDSIDSYNEDVLESCDLPPDSTLVRTFVLRVYSPDDDPLRSLSHVYALPAETGEILSFYGLGQPDRERVVSRERACRFGQRPAALVVTFSGAEGEGVASVTEAGSTDVIDLTDPPPGTRSLLRLRLAQLETEGWF